MSRQAAENENLAIYNSVYGGRNDLYVSGQYDLALKKYYIETVRKFFGDTSGKPVLNLGADAAGIFGTLCDIGNIGISLDIAFNKLSGNSQVREASYVNARAQDLPFADNSIHGVLAFDIIEHLIPEDSENMLEEVYRVLAPGQKVVLTTPNTDCLARRTRRVIDPYRTVSRPDHVNEMSHHHLTTLFKNKRFDNIRSHGVSILPGLQRLQRYLPFEPIYIFDHDLAQNYPQLSAEVLFIATKLK